MYPVRLPSTQNNLDQYNHMQVSGLNIICHFPSGLSRFKQMVMSFWLLHAIYYNTHFYHTTTY